MDISLHISVFHFPETQLIYTVLLGLYVELLYL